MRRLRSDASLTSKVLPTKSDTGCANSLNEEYTCRSTTMIKNKAVRDYQSRTKLPSTMRKPV